MSSSRFTPRQACALMIKIADAIQYSHEAGVVHRDLKPGNILLDFQDEPHILDFGLSQSLQPSGDSLAVTGKAMGTPAYMPPEQVVGDVDQIGPRSDVYALGVILFQLLTNELPYAGSSSQIFSEVLSKDPTPPRRLSRGIPAALEAICLRAMARAPAARYPSAANFAQDLQRFLAGRRVTAYPHWDWRVVCGFGRRHRVLLGGAALLAISFAAARAWLPPEIAAPQRQTVMIESIPPGAELTWTRLDVNATTGQPAAVGKISTGVPAGSARHFAGRPVALEPGFYKVVAQADDEYFEVYRTVPVPRQMPLLSLQGVPQRHRSFQWDGAVARLPAIRLIPAGQSAGDGVDLPGGTVTIPNDPYFDLAVRGKSAAVFNVRIDRREVTFGQLRAAFPQIHGLPAEDDSVAAYAIPYDVAVAYAEAVGKNVPTIWEMIWAASNQGTTRFSWGSQQPDLELVAIAADPSRFPDRTPGPEPIFDLQLGRVEWTETFRVTLVLGDQQIPGSLEERIVYGALLDSRRNASPNATTACSSSSSSARPPKAPSPASRANPTRPRSPTNRRYKPLFQ